MCNKIIITSCKWRSLCERVTYRLSINKVSLIIINNGYTSASSQSETSASAEQAESGIATAAVFLFLSLTLDEIRRVERSSVDFFSARRLNVSEVYLVICIVV